jgi:hypothetical protein
VDLTEVTYCGLYCSMCASRRRIPAQAEAFRDSLVKEGYDLFGKEIPVLAEGWDHFRAVLDHLAANPCPGCRAGGGYPACPIRVCARDRGVTTCAECDEWPCDKSAFLARYVNLRGDVERLRKIGMERWLAEQEERAATGFCYADIRLPADGT